MIDDGCCREMDNECNCDCHHGGEDMEITHCVTCCFKCPHCRLNISTHIYDEHEKQCEREHILDIELGYFDKNREGWCKHYVGKFALIKGVTVHDFYDTQNRAYEVGCQIWGLVPFLIKEVQLVDEVIFMPDRFVVKVMDEDQDD